MLVSAGGQQCAIPSGAVLSVHRAVAVSPLPQAPPVVEGMIDVHGEAMVVLDLAHRLGGAKQSVALDHMLVLVAAGDRRLALHVEHDVDLVMISEDELRDSRSVRADYASGLAVLAEGLVVIHDPQAFLSSDETVALDAALARDAETTP